MADGWVYIMTNRPNGTLYVGVTDNLARRAWEHREGLVEGFTKRYGLTRLVYAEHHDDIRQARQREQVVYEMATCLVNSRWVPKGLFDRAVKALGHIGITASSRSRTVAVSYRSHPVFVDCRS